MRTWSRVNTSLTSRLGLAGAPLAQPPDSCFEAQAVGPDASPPAETKEHLVQVHAIHSPAMTMNIHFVERLHEYTQPIFRIQQLQFAMPPLLICR